MVFLYNCGSFFEDCSAGLADFIAGIAFLLARCFYCISDLGFFMTCRFDSLCLGCFADTAGVSFHSICGASGFCCYFSCIPGMIFLCNCGSFFEDCSAGLADFIAGIAFLLARCFYCISDLGFFMACCLDSLCLGCFADTAGVGLHSICGASCFCCYFSCIPAVVFLYNCGSFFEDCSAGLADFIAGIAFLLARCFYCISDLGFFMACCLDSLCLGCFADTAGVGLHSICGASCLCCYFSCVPAVLVYSSCYFDHLGCT